MRAMRKVSLSFSLVAVPCKVYKASEPNEVGMHQVHNHDGGRIRYRRYCEFCQADVPFEDTGKGFLLPDRLVPLTEDDLQSLPLNSSRELAVGQFVDATDIDPMLMNGQHYYLGPDLGGDRGYLLMAEALAKSGRVALAKAALHGRERIAVIRPVDDVLVMDMLSWPEEIRNSAEVPFKETPKANPEEVDLAIQLIDALTAPFDPSTYSDGYAAALAALVERKTAEPGAVIAEPPQPAIQAAVPSMALQLEASLKAVQDEASK